MEADSCTSLGRPWLDAFVAWPPCRRTTAVPSPAPPPDPQRARPRPSSWRTETDGVVPYGGGTWQGYTSAQDAYDAWYPDNGCTSPTRTYDITTATYDATACTFGTFRNTIQFVTVHDVSTFSSHAWPTFDNSGYEVTNGMINFWDAQ